MIELFQLWALVEVVGLICLPLTITLFHNLPDRGWAFTKTIGMALLSFCVWLPLMTLRFLPYHQLFILGVVFLLLACNLLAFLRLRQKILKIVRLDAVYIITTELIFLGMVFLLGWMRSYGPEIRSYEMFMDEGFIASIMRSPHLPPSDMWFAGYSINYYYYAHFALATFAKLLGQSPSIAFNTGICIFFGLTAVNLFGVTCNIVNWARYMRSRFNEGLTAEPPATVYLPLRRSMPFGFLALVMALILGNLAATQQWWQSHGSFGQFDWWSPSRVITNTLTINEFPAFSFILACFHAHVLALAFTIVAIGLAFNLLLESEGKGLFVFGRGWQLAVTLGMTALIIGGLFTMNGWDYPTYMGLAVVCIVLQHWLAYRMQLTGMLVRDILIAVGSLIALSFLLYLPFYLNFVSPSQGIGIVGPTQRSPISGVLLIYGIFAFVFISFLFVSVLRQPLPFRFASLTKEGEDEVVQANWSLIGLVSVICMAVGSVLSLIFLQNSITFVVVANVAVLAAILVFYTIGDRAHAFTLLLGTIAFALVAVCEIFFLKDVFAGTDALRMNTVFKFYFQAWVLLSIASSAGVYFIVSSFPSWHKETPAQFVLKGSASTLWLIALLGFLLAGFVYPIGAAPARYAQPGPSWQRSNSLDGLTYLKDDPAHPGDYAAIRWLNEHVQGTPVLVEAVGDDYSNFARISAFTGLPTLMGWAGHEYQWRVNWLNIPANLDEFNRRKVDVDTIYQSPDKNQVLSTLAHYQAQYVYVGPLEYSKYLQADLKRFSAYMQVVYNANGVTIYKVL